jgi:hypothetical protein
MIMLHTRLRDDEQDLDQALAARTQRRQRHLPVAHHILVLEGPASIPPVSVGSAASAAAAVVRSYAPSGCGRNPPQGVVLCILSTGGPRKLGECVPGSKHAETIKMTMLYDLRVVGSFGSRNWGACDRDDTVGSRRMQLLPGSKAQHADLRSSERAALPQPLTSCTAPGAACSRAPARRRMPGMQSQWPSLPEQKHAAAVLQRPEAHSEMLWLATAEIGEACGANGALRLVMRCRASVAVHVALEMTAQPGCK